MRCWPLLLSLFACSGPAVETRPMAAATPQPTPAPAPLRVVTFNIRYGTALDGANHWRHRRELCATCIRRLDPDLLGVQEALAFQNEYLASQCPGYTVLGVGRDDGMAAGEFSSLFVRTARFHVEASGTFWYGDTPDRPGRPHLDAALPRIATWARLRDHQAGDRPLLVVNTHFDHRGAKARTAAAQQLRTFAAQQAAGAAVVVLGDFNTPPDSEPHQQLTANAADGFVLVDALRTVLGQAEADAGTFHAFGKQREGQRIDWILHSSALSATAAGIDRTRAGALYPSDHDAVFATLRWR
jgi:endonuclease/exonuclease/phosphatase family metal-dependent hydrolase